MKIWLNRYIGLMCLSFGLGMIVRYAISPSDLVGISSAFYAVSLLTLTMIIVGFIVLKKCYKTKPGISISPAWVTWFYDGISLVFGGAAMISVVDLGYGYVWNIGSAINDDFITFMSVFFVLFGIAILAFYTSRLTSQSVEVDENQIKLHGMFGAKKILWSDLEAFGLSDEYVLVGRAGTMIPRKLQKRLKLTSKFGDDIFINEPQVKSKKKTIIASLKSFAPKNILPEFSTLLKAW